MINKEYIIEKSKEKHHNKYDYTLITYDINNVNDKIDIICSKHGHFKQSFWNHAIQGKGCKHCGRERTTKASKLTDEEIYKRMNEKYDIGHYTFIDLKNHLLKDKVIIRCKYHGNFTVRLEHFLNGVECQYCKKRLKNDNDVINELSLIHPELDFSITKYSQRDKNYRIDVICPKHGISHLNYYNLRNGKGCDLCKISKLEKECEKYLKINNIKYIREHTFTWLYNPLTKYKLSLDFYLPEYNVAIECQGRQHFEVNDFFGGEDAFKSTIERDKIKKELCEKHSIEIYYFSHEIIDYPYYVYNSIFDLIKNIKNKD